MNESLVKPENTLLNCIETIKEPLHVLKQLNTGFIAIYLDSVYQQLGTKQAHYTHLGILPSIYPEWLGSPHFIQTHKIRYPYIVGEMANGIATAKMVVAAAKAGMLGFFGAAGLHPTIIEKNLQFIHSQLGPEYAWGSNLINSPHEPQLEEAAVELYLKYGVRRISASAYMNLTPALVRYACSGLSTDSTGKILRQNYIIAKISRPEIAKLFMQPAPKLILDALTKTGKINQEEAGLAQHIPLATDITVEADSGGHTDNRPLTALFPTICSLAKKMEKQFGYQTSIRVGAAGGIGNPSACAAAFSLGAAYVLTGSINQSAVESGLSSEGKTMLASAGIADMMMAAAADMFELGVKLQVLKKGSLFGSRANKLYEIYSHYDAIDKIPANEKLKLEEQIFGTSLEQIWQHTAEFFQQRDPGQIIKAEQNPKHKMALVFRWYLGLSSHWAIEGNKERKADYQIWCGPAMGTFNNWVTGSFLEDLQQRTVAQIGLNLLQGAAVVMRAQQLRLFGMDVSLENFDYRPRYLS